MLLSELMERIAHGEHSGMEFKRDDVRPEQLAREIVAMANLNGGMILLGVEDDGSISGITRKNLQEWVLNVFRDKVHPMIIPYYEVIALSGGKKVAVVSFPQGLSKPYVVRHNGREDAYVRLGSRSELASREQYIRLSSIGGLIHTELLPVSGTALDSLDPQRIIDYLIHIIGETDDLSSPETRIQKLVNLGLMIPLESGQRCATIAGMVLFGLKPRLFLRSSGIRLTVYPTLEKDFETLLDVALDECLVGQWETISGVRQLVRGGLLEIFMKTLEPFLSKEKVIDSIRREKRWSYPVEAVREVVVNALVHRDWSRWVDIEVSVYPDRMEVISPGSLQNFMTVEKMIEGQRSHRNPVLVETARDYGYMEARGMGIRRKVIPSITKAAGKMPEFVCTEDYVKVVLFPAIESE